MIETLAMGNALPPENRDHDLTGNWRGHRECHIQPDWLLIYRIEGDVLVLTLSRTGTHSDLFGNEHCAAWGNLCGILPFTAPVHGCALASAAASTSDNCAAWSSAHAAGRFSRGNRCSIRFQGNKRLNLCNDLLALRKLLGSAQLIKLTLGSVVDDKSASCAA